MRPQWPRRVQIHTCCQHHRQAKNCRDSSPRKYRSAKGREITLRDTQRHPSHRPPYNQCKHTYRKRRRPQLRTTCHPTHPQATKKWQFSRHHFQLSSLYLYQKSRNTPITSPRRHCTLPTTKHTTRQNKRYRYHTTKQRNTRRITVNTKQKNHTFAQQLRLFRALLQYKQRQPQAQRRSLRSQQNRTRTRSSRNIITRCHTNQLFRVQATQLQARLHTKKREHRCCQQPSFQASNHRHQKNKHKPSCHRMKLSRPKG